MALRECRLLAFPKFSFRSRAVSSLGLRTRVLAIEMRAARSDLVCAAPKSAARSPHHGEARCDRRSRLGARCRRRGRWRRTVRSSTAAWRDDTSAGCPNMLTMAADREESRRLRRFISQPRYYAMGYAPEPARRFASRHAELRWLSRYSAHAAGRAPRFSPCEGYEPRRYGNASPTAC